MLDVLGENGVKNPIKSHDHIQYHSDIVNPHPAEREQLAQKWVRCIRVAQTPIHGKIPNRTIRSIEKGENDKDDLEAGRLMNPVQTQSHVVQNATHVFAEVNEVREDILRVTVSTKALQTTPDGRKRREETQQAGMGRITHWRVSPVGGIKTEEQFDILVDDKHQGFFIGEVPHYLHPWHMSGNNTYPRERNL